MIVRLSIRGLFHVIGFILRFVFGSPYSNLTISSVCIDFYNKISAIVPDVKSFLGVFYYFIPHDTFLPFITFVMWLVLIRVVFAIYHLIRTTI